MNKDDERIIEWAHNLAQRQTAHHWHKVTPELHHYINKQERCLAMCQRDMTIRQDEIRRNAVEIRRLRNVCNAISQNLRNIAKK